MLRLTLKRLPEYPVEAGVIAPDRFQNLCETQIGETILYHGNRKVLLRDFFEIEGDPADGRLEIHGDCRLFRSIGARMGSGFLKIIGNTGWHTGTGLCGGKIELQGDTGDYLGAEMRGGEIRLFGNAGNSVGGAYPGSRYGMRRGAIFVAGNCGHEVGSKMRRGFIAIRGSTGDYLGVNMIAGTVVCVGKIGIRPGAGLKRGSLICLGGVSEIPIHFRYSNRVKLTFLNLLSRYLTHQDFRIPEHFWEHQFVRYCGDCLTLGKGELLIPELES